MSWDPKDLPYPMTVWPGDAYPSGRFTGHHDYRYVPSRWTQYLGYGTLLAFVDDS